MKQRKRFVQLGVLLAVLGYFLWGANRQWYDSPAQKALRLRAAGGAEPADPGAVAATPGGSRPAPAPRPVGTAAARSAVAGANAADLDEEEVEFLASQEIEALAGVAIDPLTLAQEQREQVGLGSNPFAVIPVVAPEVAAVVAPGTGEPPDEVQPAAPHEFVLTGTYVSWAGECAAILDGQVVRVDDSVAEGWAVAAITEAGVRLRKPGAPERLVTRLNPLDTRPRNVPPAAPAATPAAGSIPAPANAPAAAPTPRAGTPAGGN